MDFAQNFPAVSILLCLFAGIISSGLKKKAARFVSMTLIIVVSFLSLWTLFYTIRTGQAFVYVMGKFPAPWGNEIRAGVLEAFMALFFCIIMLLSLEGGRKSWLMKWRRGKLFFIMYYQTFCFPLCLRWCIQMIYLRPMFSWRLIP